MIIQIGTVVPLILSKCLPKGFWYCNYLLTCRTTQSLGGIYIPVYNILYWIAICCYHQIFSKQILTFVNTFLAIASMLWTCILRFSWRHLLHYFLVIFVLKHFHLFFLLIKLIQKSMKGIIILFKTTFNKTPNWS